ncbi:MAG: endonuclease NucS domain-containing protein [Pseudobdellovibrionaceae bacterium]
MRADYPEWLKIQQYADGTQVAQIHRIKKVEESYGSLDENFENGTIQAVIDDLQYSTADERHNKPNPSKIKFDGNIRNNLQSYKNAVVRYLKFLNGADREQFVSSSKEVTSPTTQISTIEDDISPQRFSLERDMQATLRRNITNLSSSLRIVDDGAERAVSSGFIDITCEDANGLVVIELKAGKADSRAIGQILGYMGDLHEEEDRPVRGILIAHDFDQRTKSAAKVIPTLSLKKYSIEFKFKDME